MASELTVGTVKGSTAELNGADYHLKLQDGAGNPWYLRAPDDSFRIHRNTSGDALSISSAGLATFAGDVLLDSEASEKPLLTIKNRNGDAYGGRLILQKTTTGEANDDTLGTIQFKGNNDAHEETSYATIHSTSSSVADGAENATLAIKTISNGTVAERITIGSDGSVALTGDVMVGTTNSSVATQSTDLGAVVSEEGRIFTTTSDHHDLNRTADGETIRFRKSHVQCGSISVSAGATAFNTSSDYRLKENVTELTGALDRLDSIPVYSFNFKADPDRTVDGFLAHEVSEFVPEAIHGEKDGMETVIVTEAVEAVDAVAATLYAEGDELPDGVAVGDEKTPAVVAVDAVVEVTEEQPKYQGIDQSKLVPLMLAAIKELKAKVTALENA